MTTFKVKFGAGLATASMMLSLFTPAVFADTTVEISGNGADSKNEVEVVGTGGQSTTVEQKNKVVVEAVVAASANTGNNSVSKNTTNGGDVTLDTGKADASAYLTVTGGNNDATVQGCGCEPVVTDVLVSGNGVDSTNKVTIKNKKTKKSAKQKSKTLVAALVGADADTGYNKVKKNTTGSGAVEVTTDDATSTADMTVEAGHNTVTL